MTIVFATLVHAALALGVSFEFSDEEPAETLPSLDVILVQRKSENAPDDADFLAQANQVGGGDQEEAERPRSPLASPIPRPEPGTDPVPSSAASPPQQQQKPTEIITREQAQVTARVEPSPTPAPPEPKPNAAELMRQSRELARLEAEIGQEIQAYAKRPRKAFVSANTREYEFASYMQAWVAKVERVGNLNYPDEARRQRIDGSLVLAVSINADGNVVEIDIVRPSGYRVLDEAANRIVELAAPYAPFPPSLRERIDIIHITRTWRFSRGGLLSEG